MRDAQMKENVLVVKEWTCNFSFDEQARLGLWCPITGLYPQVFHRLWIVHIIVTHI